VAFDMKRPLIGGPRILEITANYNKIVKLWLRVILMSSVETIYSQTAGDTIFPRYTCIYTCAYRITALTAGLLFF
jgi:hypothetical protein